MSESNIQCPRCNAHCRLEDKTCWLCQSSLTDAAPPDFRPPPLSPATHTFTITSIMLVTTLIAVCFGLFNIAPGLAILMCVISLPALIRTSVLMSRRKQAGYSADAGEKIVTFMAALGGVILAGVAAIAVFWGTCAIACLAPNIAEESFVILLPLSVVLGLIAGGLVMRALWRRRKA